MKRNILIITQKVDRNDQVLGFFHEWIKEFSKYYTVSVICLYKGEYDLPGVSVYSLGKENGESRIKYLFNLYKYLVTIKFDKVFVHMNQIYVPLVWIFGKPVYLWYTHRKTSLSLYLCSLFVTKVFTASLASFRLHMLPSELNFSMGKKIVAVGHGIDMEYFSPASLQGDNIITIGRISPTKGQLDIVKAYEMSGVTNKLVIVGGPITKEDREYEKILRGYKNVEFTGPIAPQNIVEKYRSSKLFVHIGRTGSLDKVVLEAIACGLTVISTNRSFRDWAYISSGEPEDLSEKIEYALKHPLLSGREEVLKKHNLKPLIQRLSQEMK